MTQDRPPRLELTQEKIFPKTAKEWLEHNTHNRKISDRLVEVYAEAMQAGEWVLNGEPIIFDREGRLQSGQHRLLAVIEAGTPIWSVVVRGAEPDNLYTLDTGRKRRFTDVLTLKGEKNTANLATAITWHWRYEHNLMDRPGIIPTTSRLLTHLSEHPTIRESIYAVATLHRELHISAGLFGALHYALTNINEEEGAYFFEHLATGLDLDADSPIYALRRWLIRSRQGERRPTSTNYAAITIKAWNAYRNHTPLRALRWAANESFPEAE